MNISKLVDFFTGRAGVYADECNSEKFITFLLRNNINCDIRKDTEKGGVYTEIEPKILKKIAPSLDKSGIIVYIIYINGMLRLFSKYRYRPGLVIGALLFCAAIWASTIFIWKVDVVGTDTLSKEQVRTELAQMGVCVGRTKASVDKNTVGNEFLASHPELSWAALNFTGTTATLVVKETQKPPDGKPDSDIEGDVCVLVASEDGLVFEILAFEGVPVVKVGSVVKKGDVLISGLISGQGLHIVENPPLRLGRASGSVTAMVEREYSFFVPLGEEVKKTSMSDKTGKIITVFGKSIKWGKHPSDGEISVSESKNISFFGFIEIPVIVTTVKVQTEYTQLTSRLPEEAKKLALEGVYRYLADDLKDGELLSQHVEFYEDDSGCRATVVYTAYVEIAKPYYIGRGNQ